MSKRKAFEKNSSTSENNKKATVPIYHVTMILKSISITRNDFNQLCAKNKSKPSTTDEEDVRVFATITNGFPFIPALNNIFTGPASGFLMLEDLLTLSPECNYNEATIQEIKHANDAIDYRVNNPAQLAGALLYSNAETLQVFGPNHKIKHLQALTCLTDKLSKDQKLSLHGLPKDLIERQKEYADNIHQLYIYLKEECEKSEKSPILFNGHYYNVTLMTLKQTVDGTMIPALEEVISKCEPLVRKPKGIAILKSSDGI